MNVVNTEVQELIKKLNLMPDKGTYILHAPLDYDLLDTPKVGLVEDIQDQFNWVQAFYYHEEDLTRELPALEEKMSKDGMLWICWPKRSANKGSNLSDNVVRSLGIACGLVDTKVASIDEVWSSLKFVYRTIDR